MIDNGVTNFCMEVQNQMLNGRLNEKQALASALNKLRVTDEDARSRLVSEFYVRKRAGLPRAVAKVTEVAEEPVVITRAMRLGAYNADRRHRKTLGDDY